MLRELESFFQRALSGSGLISKSIFRGPMSGCWDDSDQHPASRKQFKTTVKPETTAGNLFSSSLCFKMKKADFLNSWVFMEK